MLPNCPPRLDDGNWRCVLCWFVCAHPTLTVHCMARNNAGSVRPTNRSAQLRAASASSTRRMTPTDIAKLKSELLAAQDEVLHLEALSDSLRDSARDAATDLGEQLGELAAKHQDAEATSQRLRMCARMPLVLVFRCFGCSEWSHFGFTCACASRSFSVDAPDCAPILDANITR